MGTVHDERPRYSAIEIRAAREHELDAVLALVEDLLMELGEEGREFAGIDGEKLRADLERRQVLAQTAATGPGSGPTCGRFLALLARNGGGVPIGVLTLSTGFALYAGGQYGVIDEMYVIPEHRGRGVGRRPAEAAIDIARERRWFRLDVTGPAGAGPGGGTGFVPAAAREAAATRAVRFYQDLGFEFTGPKLRLLVADRRPGVRLSERASP